MKRTLPLAILFITGMWMIFSFYIKGEAGFFKYLDQGAEWLKDWVMIMGAFAIGIGVINVSRIHIHNILRKRPGWYNSVFLFIAMFVFIIVGFYEWWKEGTVTGGPIFQGLYNYIIVPLSATMFSMLAFYIASAAYRAFRARTMEAVVLLVAATLVMLGRVPLGEKIWADFPLLTDWIMAVPNKAGMRGILIAATIGVLSLGIRTLMGRERGVLGPTGG
ncbi:hypothetical protein DRN46_05735 [Thermococci archaeon]|nr:MAG: hypothetical protein DRN46_05735 [Thermococci archaeon]